MVNTIDSIFQKVKKTVGKDKKQIGKPASGKGSDKKVVGKSDSIATPGKSKTSNQDKGSSNDPFSLQQKVKDKSQDFTEEGWRIYTPDELNIGKGGDTELCPFDCDCCF